MSKARKLAADMEAERQEKKQTKRAPKEVPGAEPANGEAYRLVNSDGNYWQQLTPRPDYRIEHFRSHVPDGKYICITDGKLWTDTKLGPLLGLAGLFHPNGAPVLNKRKKPIEKASLTVLDGMRSVAGVTWWPGMPRIIDDRMIDQGVWIDHPNAHLFNEYRPPLLSGGDPREGERWADFVRDLYPDDSQRIIRYAAYCRQHPEGKINHAILLIGQQGIGKDTLLAPIRTAVGEHNWRSIGPAELTGTFKPWLKCVVLQINESREDESFNRFRYYDALKEPTAAPPELVMCNEKHKAQVWVRKPTGVFINSNFELDATFLPRDDRRIDVALSPRDKAWKDEAFFKGLYDWYEQSNGFAHVAAYLDSHDNSTFAPKGTPYCSDAKRVIINASRPVQEGELADALDWLLNPLVVTVPMVLEYCDVNGNAGFGEWLSDQSNYKQLAHRFHENGYVTLENPDRADGRWKIDARRQTVYALKSATKAEVLAAARKLALAGLAGVMGAMKRQRDGEAASLVEDELY